MATVIYAGDCAPGTTSEMRLRALRDLGFAVTAVGDHLPVGRSRLTELAVKVSYKLRRPLDLAGLNRRLPSAVATAPAGAILWIDKGVAVRPTTLREIRRRRGDVTVIGFSPDDMAARHNNSAYFIGCLPHYHAFLTTKSYGVAELAALGCPRVIFVPNSYDPETHRPMPLDDDATRRFACDIGFIGHFEADRAAAIAAVAEAGFAVTVRGNGWTAWRRRAPNNIVFGPAEIGDDYARVISATRINLGFLRRVNRDLQTTRSIEIPACGGFMLAERSGEHLDLFEEGKEAEFFGSVDELIRKIRQYLADEDRRRAVAEAGRQRCLRDDYSYAGRLRLALRELGLLAAPLAAVAAP